MVGSADDRRAKESWGSGEQEWLASQRQGLLDVECRRVCDVVGLDRATRAPDKRGSIPAELAPILERLGIEGSMWCDLVWEYKKYFGKSSSAGASDRMKEHALANDRKFTPGNAKRRSALSDIGLTKLRRESVGTAGEAMLKSIDDAVSIDCSRPLRSHYSRLSTGEKQGNSPLVYLATVQRREARQMSSRCRTCSPSKFWTIPLSDYPTDSKLWRVSLPFSLYFDKDILVTWEAP